MRPERYIAGTKQRVDISALFCSSFLISVCFQSKYVCLAEVSETIPTASTHFCNRDQLSLQEFLLTVGTSIISAVDFFLSFRFLFLEYAPSGLVHGKEILD